MVTSQQSPHLLLPFTSFGPQGHKIPAEIQPPIRSYERATCRATCDRPPETDRICTESHHSTDEQEQIPCDEARDYWENRKGRRVRVHGIARRTPFDPVHDEQPLCQNLTERRRTTAKFLGQQSEMTIDDTRPQTGEMRSLWKNTTELLDT